MSQGERCGRACRPMGRVTDEASRRGVVGGPGQRREGVELSANDSERGAWPRAQPPNARPPVRALGGVSLLLPPIGSGGSGTPPNERRRGVWPGGTAGRGGQTAPPPPALRSPPPPLPARRSQRRHGGVRRAQHPAAAGGGRLPGAAGARYRWLPPRPGPVPPEAGPV